MSEEEIIKKANAIIENHREIDKMMVIEMVDLIQGLLDLYTKEKEKNKELKMQLEVEKIDNKYNQEEASEEMIPRYKIKEKIEELNKEYKEAYNKGFKTDMVNRLREIKLMQSLLEKE